ncbi:MAG: hypothetical protein IPM96_16185 [Ignavibacteria bacterium]|nr:hypothetical protein [Ignavibacteria bacterium]
MAVVQGNSIEAINYCAEKLNKLNFKFIGIPLSSYSKKRQYESAVLKVIAIRKNFPSNVTFHALGCGSRTLIAILTYFGVRFFDSSSFYKVAMIDAFYDNEEFCSINRPNSKAECKFCLQKQRKHKSYKQKIKYNLIEVQKEIQRCRCALEANLMREYLLDYRLNKSTANKISYLLTSENHS